jgi:predicted ATP-grasp superfamily ATP-dependent carboligase
MRILIYEWSCSGGLSGPDAPAIGAAAEIRAEGEAMFRGLLGDAGRDPSLTVTAVVDADRPVPLPTGACGFPVPAGAEIEALVAAATRADVTVLVAPETDGMLARRVAAVRAARGVVLASDASFIDLAADKQATIQALAAAGVPVPAGRPLEAGVAWPAGFMRPAVRKPRDGVGGAGLTVVRTGDPDPPPAGHATRVEALAEGIPVGVACLCGPRRCMPLAPLRQRFASGPGSGYVGGEPLADPAAARRAAAVAVRAVAALARAAGDHARGWVGVDMILGDRADGRADRVLEVNPRLTSSFVGHAAGAGTSLLRQLLDVAAGRDVRIESHPSPFRLAADDATAPAVR